MITEDYCSPEVSKLLEKKGFREYCEAIYFVLENGDYRWSKIDIPIRDCSTCKPAAILCPTHQMAMKWLRKKGIFVLPDIRIADGKWFCMIVRRFEEVDNGCIGERRVNGYYDTYEEAVEAAIKYSLENLIEL